MHLKKHLKKIKNQELTGLHLSAIVLGFIKSLIVNILLKKTLFISLDKKEHEHLPGPRGYVNSKVYSNIIFFQLTFVVLPEFNHTHTLTKLSPTHFKLPHKVKVIACYYWDN